MAIVLAVMKWCHYLLRWRFLIKTDQRSLRFDMEQREIGAEYQRSITKLMRFDFNII